MTSVIQAVEVDISSGVAGDTYYRAFYSDSLIQYEGRALMEKDSGGFDTVAATGTRKLDSREWASYYFIFHKDSAYGTRFPVEGDSTSEFRRVPVDSMLEIIKGTNTWEKMPVKPDSVIKQVSQLPSRKFGYVR